MQNQNINQTSSNYNNDYLSWKGWESERFGLINKYGQRYFEKEISRSRLSLKKDSKVLEIGFGNGSFLQFARQKGWQICGTEANINLVDLAKSKGFDAYCVNDLAIFQNEQFELIVAFDVLEHIPQDQITSFLLEVKRILKHGGVFIARFPNGDSPFGLYCQNGDVTHVTTIGSNKIKYFCNKIDVDLVFSGGESEVILGRNPLSILRRALGYISTKVINFLYFLFYFERVSFCSRNLIMIFSKR